MDCGCAGGGFIHQSQSEMFLGKGGAGVEKMPSPHVKEMPNRCIECHVKSKGTKIGGHTFTADTTICAKCHEDTDERLKSNKTEIYKLLEQTESLLKGVSDKKSKTYKEAKLNYDMVKSDGGCGFHNFKYAKALLEYSISILTDSKGMKNEEHLD